MERHSDKVKEIIKVIQNRKDAVHHHAERFTPGDVIQVLLEMKVITSDQLRIWLDRQLKPKEIKNDPDALVS